MNTLHLRLHQQSLQAGLLTCSSSLVSSFSDERVLWFKVPGDCADYLTGQADPFVIGWIFTLMQAAQSSSDRTELLVHGNVSPSLITNLREFQRAWSMWRPDLYGTATIRATNECEEPPIANPRGSVMCFSGGVDSSFTAFSSTRAGSCSDSHSLDACVMAQGWDFAEDEDGLFDRAAARSERILDSLGLPLIRIATNFRSVVPNWSHSHGAAIVAILTLLQRRFSEGLVAQTMTYRNNHLSLEGVNPMTDWLLSSRSFSSRPHGAGATRLEKIEALSHWPEFLENVRVCWQDETNKPYNCCACEKCIRTILQFKALGLGVPPAFPRDVSKYDMDLLSLSSRMIEVSYEPILREARRRGITDRWVRDLSRVVARSRRHARIASRPRWLQLHHLALRKTQLAMARRAAARDQV
jgi:hypothetical protein